MSRIPVFCREATMSSRQGNVNFLQYRITRHSIERYTERTGGDLGDMLMALKSAWLLCADHPGLRRAIRWSIQTSDESGGWCLTDGKAVFVIKPDGDRHVVVTTLSLNA